MERGFELFGPAVDILLNSSKTYWRGIPKAVWECRVGGYSPVSRWISSRKKLKRGEALDTTDTKEFFGVVRRLATLILMTDSLDGNYLACCDNAWEWPKGE